MYRFLFFHMFALTEFSTLSLHDALPISMILGDLGAEVIKVEALGGSDETRKWGPPFQNDVSAYYLCANRDRKSTRLNSSHVAISYAVFCLKKKIYYYI